MEFWKDIPGYEGIYQASTCGQIRSVEGKTTSNKRYGVRTWKSRILKGRGNNPTTGKRVNLWKEGKAKDYLVARLVALTFLGEPEDGFTVNHKDGNRFNNNIENLEWLSLADNIRHGFETGLYHCQKPISVIGVGDRKTYRFRSLSEFDRFLDRSTGYASNTINRSRKTFTDSRGKMFRLVSL